MCLKVVFTRGWVGERLFLGIGMFTTSDDDWQSDCRGFSNPLGLNRVSSVWRNFQNRCKSCLCYVISISPAISYCDFVCYLKVTSFISVV
jgi:hypothetical protein